MFDDAEKKIARLMRESTTSGESKSGLGKIRVKGKGNLVALGAINVTINLHAAAHGSTDAVVQVNSSPSQVADNTSRTLHLSRELIRQRCDELGDPDLYKPFISSLFKTDQLEALSRRELGRLECWLGLRNERPSK